MKRVCGFAVSYIRDALLRRIAVLRTDRVVLSVSLSVGLSVSHTSGPCKNDRSDRVAVCVEDSGGPKEPCITWGPNPPMGRAILRDKRANHCKVYAHSAVICAKTAEPINLLFGLWTQVGRRMHRFNRIRQVAPMCCHGRTHCRHLANAIEPSVYGRDALYVKLL